MVFIFREVVKSEDKDKKSSEDLVKLVSFNPLMILN